jgi:hypothetical protein
LEFIFFKGDVTAEDLKGVYDVRVSQAGKLLNSLTYNLFLIINNFKHNKKFLNGEMSEEQLLKQFLATFEVDGKKDGSVIIFFNKFSFKKLSIIAYTMLLKLLIRSPRMSLSTTIRQSRPRSTMTCILLP